MVLSFLGVVLMFAFIFPSGTTTQKAMSIEVPEKDVCNNFSDFLKLFPEKELPYSVTIEDLAAFDKMKIDGNEKILEEFLPELEKSFFSRVPPPVIKPIQSFKINDFISVIYIFKHYYRENNASVVCSIFDKKGNFLSSNNISWSSLENITTCSIDKNCIFEIVIYDQIWKKDIEKYGAKNNEIVKRKKKDIRFFQIEKNGFFKELKEYKTTGRASLN